MRATDVWEIPKRCPISPSGVAVSAYSQVTSISCSSLRLRAGNTRLAAIGAGVDGAWSCSVEGSVAVVVVVIESLLFHVACALSIDATFMQALGVEHAHVAGLSLGAATPSGWRPHIPSGSPSRPFDDAFLRGRQHIGGQRLSSPRAAPVEDEMLYGALIT